MAAPHSPMTCQVGTGCHAVPEAQPSTYVTVLGQSPFASRCHPPSPPDHCRITATKTPFTLLTTARINLNPTKNPRGITLNPQKASMCPKSPQKTDTRFSPCNKTLGVMEGARSSRAATSCRGKRLWLPSPPASCSNHLFCFYFRKRRGWALGGSQPPQRRAKRQISAAG